MRLGIHERGISVLFEQGTRGEKRAPLQTTALGIGFSRLQPALQRCLCLAGPASRQQALDADVLIQVGPVDSRTLSNKPPVSSLSGVRGEAREQAKALSYGRRQVPRSRLRGATFATVSSAHFRILSHSSQGFPRCRNESLKRKLRDQSRLSLRRTGSIQNLASESSASVNAGASLGLRIEKSTYTGTDG